MSVLFVLLPVALILAGISVWACVWAVRNGQYDDTDTPQLRMLKDDPKQP
jgi:cbb3-type cytochrome oxidase maturation protein